MATASTGNSVKVEYTGKFTDGTVFDSSAEQGEPLQFTLGEGMLIPGFEQAVIGMEPGDEKTVNIPADEGYGPHHDQLVAVVERDQFPPEITPEVGQPLQVVQPGGQPMMVMITDIDGDKVTLDANHPLAGRDLVFEIKLVEIGE